MAEKSGLTVPPAASAVFHPDNRQDFDADSATLTAL
jgi:hypothetical protein